MASVISASTTSATALNMSADTSGVLQFATGATPTTAVTISTAQNVTFAVQATIPTINLTGGQITFPATQSASADANTLDDYEEGTWTPTNPASGYTFSSTSGRYTKIGRMVYVNCTLAFSAVNAGSNSSCTFTGLPFTVANTTSGVFRDDTTTGAVYLFRVSSSNGEINSMDGIASGSQRTIRINETYIGFAVYEV